MRLTAVVLIMLAVAASGQERVRFTLRDGSEVTGTVLTGDTRSIVVETDSGRVSLDRSSIAGTAILLAAMPLAAQAAAGADVHELGVAAGRKAADDAISLSWFAGTCCAGSVCWPLAAPVAASLAWRSKATLPTSLLAGVPGDYAAGFTDGYVQRATERRRIQTITGIVGSGVMFAVVVAVITNQVAHSLDGFHFDLGWGDL